MKGCQDVLRRGSEEAGENELGSAEGTGQRVSCEARFEHVAPGAVDRVDGAVERIEKFIDDGEELAADALGQAHSALGEIGGRVSADGLLGHIFSSFCIGK